VYRKLFTNNAPPKPPPTPPKEGSAKQMTEKNERKDLPRPLKRRGETSGVMIKKQN